MRREATICAGRPISAPAVAKPQHDGSWRAPTNAPVCRSDSNHMRRRGAKSFVDDLVLSRGVVLSRADLFCDLLRLSPMTRRFVRFRRTYLRGFGRGGGGHRRCMRVRSVASERIARGATFCRLVPVCMPDGPPARHWLFKTTSFFAICYMRQLACRTARGVCLGRALARSLAAKRPRLCFSWRLAGKSLPTSRREKRQILSCMPDGPHLACRTARRLLSWRLS